MRFLLLAALSWCFAQSASAQTLMLDRYPSGLSGTEWSNATTYNLLRAWENSFTTAQDETKDVGPILAMFICDFAPSTISLSKFDNLNEVICAVKAAEYYEQQIYRGKLRKRSRGFNDAPFELLMAYAQKGEPRAQYEVARMIQNGNYNTSENSTKWFKLAIQNGSSIALSDYNKLERYKRELEEAAQRQRAAEKSTTKKPNSVIVETCAEVNRMCHNSCVRSYPTGSPRYMDCYSSCRFGGGRKCK